MVTIIDPNGDFDVVITFTNPSATSKDTESDNIKLVGGSVVYNDNGTPNSATIILENTTDSLWIDELFDVEIKTKGTAEGTYLYRFIGRTQRPVIENNKISIACVGHLHRLKNRFATRRWFFDTLYDQDTFDTESGTPNFADLNAAKRPIRPLIEVEYLDVLRYMFDEEAWHHVGPAYLDGIGQIFSLKKRQVIGNIMLMLGTHVVDPDFTYRVAITGVQENAGGTIVPDESNILAQSPMMDSEGLIAFGGGSPDDGPKMVPITAPIPLEPYTKYGLYIYISTYIAAGLHVRVSPADPPEQYDAGYACTLAGTTWTETVNRDLWFWIYGLGDEHWRTLRESIDFNVDYDNKKILFDYTDVFDPVLWPDVIKATYFGGYPTISNIITALHDDYLSDFTDSTTINPTANLNIRPFRIKEATVLSLIKEILKLGPWSTRLYKNTSGNNVFEFTDAYVPADWGSAPFTGDFQTDRNFYFGGEVSPPAGSVRIVTDERRKIGSERVTAISGMNPDADLLISIVDPVGISDYGRMGFPTATVKVADNLDELVEFVELLFQIHSQQIVHGNITVDKVSMLTTKAMLTHCNDLVYIKDGRVGFDGAFKLTRIVWDLKKWDFRLTVTNARPSVVIDSFNKEGMFFSPGGELGFLDQSAFSAPKGKFDTRAEWSLSRKVIGLEDSSVDYSATHTYKIGIGDSAAVGTVMQNELAKVTCEVHETTGKIHLLDLDGDGTDEYRVAIAIFDRDDFTNPSWPITIKEAALYDDATVLKRYRFETPWPTSPATYDYFHPFVTFSNDDKLFVCFVISIP